MTFRVKLSDLEGLSEIFTDMKHRAASLRQLSFLFLTLSLAYKNYLKWRFEYLLHLWLAGSDADQWANTARVIVVVVDVSSDASNIHSRSLGHVSHVIGCLAAAAAAAAYVTAAYHTSSVSDAECGYSARQRWSTTLCDDAGTTSDCLLVTVWVTVGCWRTACSCFVASVLFRKSDKSAVSYLFSTLEETWANWSKFGHARSLGSRIIR